MSERRNPMNLIVQRLPLLETGFRRKRGMRLVRRSLMAPLGTLEDFLDPLAATDWPSRGTGPTAAPGPGGVQLAFRHLPDGEVDCAGD